MTDALLARVAAARAEHERRWEADRRRMDAEAAAEAADPDSPLNRFNAGLKALEAEAPTLGHDEVRARLAALGAAADWVLPAPYLDLMARHLRDPRWGRRHPVQALWWVLRRGRPGTYLRHWREARSGTSRLAG